MAEGTGKCDKELREFYGHSKIKLRFFCKVSARRRSIHSRFFCKINSSTCDFLFILSLFSRFGVYFGSPGAPLARLWTPKALQKAKKDRNNEVLNRPGRPEEPKGRPRRPRTSKMDPKSLQSQQKIKKKPIV